MPTMPEFDIDSLLSQLPVSQLPALALALLCVGSVKFLQTRVLPRGGDQPGRGRGGWMYLQTSGAMKLLAAICAGFALLGLWFGYLAIGYLENPGAWAGPGEAPDSNGVVFGLFLAVMVVGGGVYGALAFVRTPMRYSETEILFRSPFGREKPVRWSDVLNIDLRNLSHPVLRYKGWRHRELCTACAGFRDFLSYARLRGVEIAERSRD